MVRRAVSLAALVLLVLAFLSGCGQSAMPAIIGSIFIQAPSSLSGAPAFHVLLYAAGQTVDPSNPTSLDAVTPAAKVDGNLPAGSGISTTNFMITDVPAGTYYAFAWIDVDASGSFEPLRDYYGFYDTYTSAPIQPIQAQPESPNIVVGQTGLVDIDIWCGPIQVG